MFGETEDAAKHFSSWPSRAETRPKVGGIPGWPVAHWGGWPWILWEKIRMNHLSFNKEGQKMTVHYDVFFCVASGIFFFRAISLLFYSLGLQSHRFVRHGGIYSMSTG